MNKMKKTIESINGTVDHWIKQKKISVKLKTSFSRQRRKMKNKKKEGIKKAYDIYGTPSTKLIFTFQSSQREERKRKRQKAYFLKNGQTFLKSGEKYGHPST